MTQTSHDEHLLKDLYHHDGPFATVYLDATRSTESGEHEVALRWRALRSQLAEAGATDNDLGALDEAVEAERDRPGPHGLVLVGAGGEVHLRAHLSRPPLREIAVMRPLPYLMPYIAQRGQQVGHVVVIADRTGADVGVSADESLPSTEAVAGSEQHPIHRTARDDWSESHFQQRVENNWDANARDVAAVVLERVAQSGARLVVLAGDERARALLKTELDKQLPHGCTVTEVDQGGRADGSSEQALETAVRDAVLRDGWRRRRELLEHLRQNLGREQYAVAGVAPVVDALRRGAVDTLVISDDPSSTLTAWIGPEAAQFGLDKDELAAMGVEDPQQDRLDSALIRAVSETGARLHATPNAHDYLPEGIGALLRY